MDCFVSHIKWIISGFVDSSHQTLTLRTTIQHYIGRHNTTTAQTTTTSKIVHLPEDYWDCTILYNPFIEMSQIGDGIQGACRKIIQLALFYSIIKFCLVAHGVEVPKCCSKGFWANITLN